jgi:hypothetical protein
MNLNLALYFTEVLVWKLLHGESAGVLAAGSRSAWGSGKAPLFSGHAGHDCLRCVVRRARF